MKPREKKDFFFSLHRKKFSFLFCYFSSFSYHKVLFPVQFIISALLFCEKNMKSFLFNIARGLNVFISGFQRLYKLSLTRIVFTSGFVKI